jgi:hypothetical protein
VQHDVWRWDEGAGLSISTPLDRQEKTRVLLLTFSSINVVEASLAPAEFECGVRPHMKSTCDVCLHPSLRVKLMWGMNIQARISD